VIWADHDRLEQVFVNLLSNALSHNAPGTEVRIAIASTDSGEVEITVSDNGSGLPDSLRGAPFDSTSRPRSPTSGAGLGLSITRGIVEAHAGVIDVVSDAGGTSFRIVFPVETPEAPAEPHHPLPANV
jgi:signal transduction histidine kinase